jgi:hypothetical protein
VVPLAPPVVVPLAPPVVVPLAPPLVVPLAPPVVVPLAPPVAPTLPAAPIGPVAPALPGCPDGFDAPPVPGLPEPVCDGVAPQLASTSAPTKQTRTWPSNPRVRPWRCVRVMNPPALQWRRAPRG